MNNKLTNTFNQELNNKARLEIDNDRYTSAMTALEKLDSMEGRQFMLPDTYSQACNAAIMGLVSVRNCLTVNKDNLELLFRIARMIGDLKARIDFIATM